MKLGSIQYEECFPRDALTYKGLEKFVRMVVAEIDKEKREKKEEEEPCSK